MNPCLSENGLITDSSVLASVEEPLSCCSVAMPTNSYCADIESVMAVYVDSNQSSAPVLKCSSK